MMSDKETLGVISPVHWVPDLCHTSSMQHYQRDSNQDCSQPALIQLLELHFVHLVW